MRLQSIDALRALAIVIMVAVHFSENLSGLTLPTQGTGAPMFAVLSGVSFHLWARGQERRGVEPGLVTRRGVRRGLFLFGVGLLFNVLVWLPEDVFNWDVLTLIGSGLVVLTLARHAPSALLLGAAGILIAFAPALQVTVGAVEYWVNPWFDYDWTLSDVLIGYVAAGFFPLFPWLALPLIGMAVGRWLYADEESPRARGLRLAATGLGLLVLSQVVVVVLSGLAGPDLHAQLGGRRMFPPTTGYVLTSIGTVLLLLGLLARFVDREGAGPSLWRTLTTRFSRASFTLYLLHHVVHVWPLWILAIVRGEETTLYWRNALDQPTALALAAAFLVLCVPLLGFMERRRIPSVEQLMRWFAD